VLPRTPVVERTLAALRDRSAAPGLGDSELVEAAGVLDLLRRHGCLVSDTDLACRFLGRRRGRVALHGELAGARDLLRRSGVAVVAPGSRADVALVLGHGEVDRARLDPLVRSDTPHLVVRLVDGCAVVGPFVVPGETACLRCLDLHHSVADPDHVSVTSRYVRATARSGGAETDPVLGTLAVAWAVRDVVAHLEGRRPATWSGTLLLDPDPARQSQEVWPSHPECGCCWSAQPPMSGTMGE
jgi:bacteriocin biosynthesis cyclodehydratase domain-containing protein